jgi:hypothetical protein
MANVVFSFVGASLNKATRLSPNRASIGIRASIGWYLALAVSLIHAYRAPVLRGTFLAGISLSPCRPFLALKGWPSFISFRPTANSAPPPVWSWTCRPPTSLRWSSSTAGAAVPSQRHLRPGADGHSGVAPLRWCALLLVPRADVLSRDDKHATINESLKEMGDAKMHRSFLIF